MIRATMFPSNTATANSVECQIIQYEAMDEAGERALLRMAAAQWADKASRARTDRAVVRCLTQALYWFSIAETYQ